MKRRVKVETFPVLRLSKRVSEVLHGVNIQEQMMGVERGLNPTIRLEELNGGLENIAELHQDNQVTMSTTFCQMLWLFLYIGISRYDAQAVNKGMSESSSQLELLQYYRVLNNTVLDPKFAGRQELIYEREAYRIGRDESLLHQIAVDIYNIQHSRLDHRSMKHLRKRYPVDGPFAEFVNGAYVFGVVFMALHELAHFSLSHPVNPTVEQESEADYSAIYNALIDFARNRRELTSLCYGIAGVFAMISYVNGDDPDQTHADPKERFETLLKCLDIALDDSGMIDKGKLKCATEMFFKLADEIRHF